MPHGLCCESALTWTNQEVVVTPIWSAFLSQVRSLNSGNSWVPGSRQCEYSQCLSRGSRLFVARSKPFLLPLLLVAHPSLTWFGSTYNNRNNCSKYQRKYLSAVTPPTSVQLYWELIRCAVTEMIFWLHWFNLIKLERSERGLYWFNFSQLCDPNGQLSVHSSRHISALALLFFDIPCFHQGQTRGAHRGFCLPRAWELFSWVAVEGAWWAQRRILSKAEETVCFFHNFPVIKMLFFSIQNL